MLTEDFHRKRMSQLADAPVEYNYMETMAKTQIIHAGQNQFIQEKIFNNAPIRRKTIAMNSNSVLTGFFAEDPFWYQPLIVKDNRILGEGQTTVHHDTRDKCRLYVTTMKAMNFQEDIPSSPGGNFKDHYVLMFHLISIQDASEHVIIRN